MQLNDNDKLTGSSGRANGYENTKTIPTWYKMTGNELRTQRETILKFSQADMARRLQTPYRTYQNWERRAGDVPGIVAAAVEMLVERDRQFMAGCAERVNRPLKKIP